MKTHARKLMNLMFALLVSGFAVKETPFSHLFPEGNLHAYDRTLYARQIRGACGGASSAVHVMI